MGDKDFTKYNLSCHRQGEQRHTNNTGEIHCTTAELGRKEGRIIEARGLDLTGGMCFFSERFTFWVTAERGKGRSAGIQSLQWGVRGLQIIHVPASSVSGDDILNELE